MRNKIITLFFLLFVFSLFFDTQILAYGPGDVNFHENIQIGEVFMWEFTKFEAFDIHNPDLKNEFELGDIIYAEVISEPVFSISLSVIPQPLKEDGWIEYSVNETIIDISSGVFTAMGVYQYSFVYPLSYYDFEDNLQDYFKRYHDYYEQNFVSKSTYENNYWQKLGDDYYERKYTKRDDDGKGLVYLKINLESGFLSKVEVERHASDNEYDVHYILESVEYRETGYNFLMVSIAVILLTTYIAVRKRERKRV